MFYILIFAVLAVVLVGAFVTKWRARNDWPDDE
jgi:nitrate reductase NapE component